MTSDGEAGAHSCVLTVVVGEHQPVDDGDEQRLDVKLGFVILVVGKMGGDGDDGGGGLAVQEAAEPQSRHTRLPACWLYRKRRLRPDGLTRTPNPGSSESRTIQAWLRGRRRSTRDGSRWMLGIGFSPGTVCIGGSSAVCRAPRQLRLREKTYYAISRVESPVRRLVCGRCLLA